MAEKIDIFDCLFNPLGIEDRKVAHKQGLWHQTFHCWLIRKRGDDIFVLFQKRSANKDDSPNMLDIPAAGQLMAGEQKEYGLRELQEELGVTVDKSKLRYLGVRIEAIEVPGFNNKEFQHVYLLEDNTELEDYRLEEDEVSGLVEVKLTDGMRLLFGETEEIECDSVFLENGKMVKETYKMKVEDIIPRLDGYYQKIFVMADLYFKGYKHLCI